MVEPRLSEKPLPADIAAEEAVLGSLLIDPEAIESVMTLLDPGDFYRERNGWIYAACVDLHARGEAINQVTVAHELQRRGRLEPAGGTAYLSQLIAAVPTSVHAVDYAQIVQRLATMRRLIEAAGKIAQIGYAADPDVEASLAKAEEILFQLRTRRGATDFVHIRDVLDKYFEESGFQPRTADGELPHIPTGFIDLDRLLGGLQRSDLIILAARPSLGKSSLALSIAQNAAVRSGARVGIFSLEMSKEQLVQRLLAAESGVDSTRLRLGIGELSRIERQRVMQATGVLAGAPIYINDSPLVRITEMKSMARRLQIERGLDLLIVDYLQLVQGSSGAARDNRVQEISEISRNLKTMARELNVPVLALSQLSRAVESRSPKIPMLSDLRESGCLTGETRIINAVTGVPIRLDRLVGQRGGAVWAVDEQLALVQRRIQRAFCSGVKPVYEVELASGRRIRATSNHPFRTLDGWTPLARLTVGTPVATAGFLPAPICPVRLRPAAIVRLGRWLGARVAGLCNSGSEEAVASDRDNGTVSMTSALFRVAFALSNDQLARFLQFFWAATGWLDQTDRGPTIASTASRALVEQLQLLLLRFGIVGRIVTVRTGEADSIYTITIERPADLARFRRVLGISDRPGVASAAVTTAPVGTMSHCLRDPSRPVVVAAERRALVLVGSSQEGSRPMPAWREPFQFDATPTRMGASAQAAALVDADPWSDRANCAAIFWDRIASITPLGDRPVYDLTIAEVHNFLANGIFVHNSIEQDADIVMFIYRDDVYYTEEEWQRQHPDRPYPKGIADLIIAKHRNGPTGKVSLIFFENTTKFANLEYERGDEE